MIDAERSQPLSMQSTHQPARAQEHSSFEGGRIVKSLAVLGIAAAFAAVSILPAGAQEVMGNAEITGAGSTFAYPVIAKWSKAYQRWQAGGGDYPIAGSGLDDPPTRPALDYEPTGSLSGIMRARQAAVDFGATDMPLKSELLELLGLGQFPIVIGGVVPVVNIDGVGPGAIRFTGPVLADIYLGKIQNWADPAIKALNPDLKLPDAKIAVLHRSDGSGTTFNWALYLSKVSPQWRRQIGADTEVAWPTGTGARGNEGVSLAVKRDKNSIGYVEYSYVVRMKLSYALIQNQSGKFVRPDPRSFQSAAANADWGKTKDFYVLLTDAEGDDAYPITATTFALMQKQPGSPRRMRAVFDFFQWSLDKGAKDAADLGYVPLPATLVKQVKEYWVSDFKTGS
jgi:phosphate transport system substrate-binding protein